MNDGGKGKRGMHMKPYDELSRSGKHYRDLPEEKKNEKRKQDVVIKRKYRAENPEKCKESLKKTYRKYHDRRIKEVREYRRKFPDKVKATNRKSYFNHHDERLEASREYREDLTEKQKEEFYQQQLEWRKKNPHRVKEYYFNKRFAVILHYSNGTLICAKCGIFGYPFLTIDHIDGRKSHGHTRDYGTDKLCREILKKKFPTGFQVLCYCCNMIKEIKRPKNYSLTTRNINRRKKRYASKIDVINHYSEGTSKCECCGYSNIDGLSIDHKFGRKKMGHSRNFTGGYLYLWLQKKNYPKGYRILCLNCNCAREHFGKCPHKTSK